MFAISRRVAVVAATLVTGAAGVLGVAAVDPAQAASPAIPGCHAVDLALSLGRLDAGAGQRYQDIRIANVSNHDCRLTGYPRLRFAAAGEPIGFRSEHEGMAFHRVRLQVGDSAWTTLRYVDPGPDPASDCDATRATSLRIRLPHRPHLYRVALSAPVCTTQQYRPIAYPLRDRAVF